MASRYSLNLATPYVSAYNPANTQRFSNLMQQEYQKGMQTNAALNELESQVASMPTADIEGRNERMQAFDQEINKIKGLYNDDIALAASDLAGAIVKERQNPWYQKNAKYMQEQERRQKLVDQFGINMLFVKDLPQGNLNNMDLDDIGFEYINRLHLDDRLQKQFGKLAKKVTPLGLTEDDHGMLRYGQRQGLTADERANLIQQAQQNDLPGILKDMGFEDNPQAAQIVANELAGWVEGNLQDSYKYNYTRNPGAGTGSGRGSLGILSGLTTADTEPYKLGNYGEDVLTALTNTSTLDPSVRRQLVKRATDKMTPQQSKILDQAFDKQWSVDNPALQNLPGYQNLSPEEKASVIKELNNVTQDIAMKSGAGKAFTAVGESIGAILENAGVIESKDRFTPFSMFPSLKHTSLTRGFNTWTDFNWDKGDSGQLREMFDRDKEYFEPLKDYAKNYFDFIQSSYKPMNKELNEALKSTAEQDRLIGRNEEFQDALNSTVLNYLNPEGATSTLVYYDDENRPLTGNKQFDIKRHKNKEKTLNNILNNDNDPTVTVLRGGKGTSTRIQLTGQPKEGEENEIVEFSFGDNRRNLQALENIAIQTEAPEILMGAYDNIYEQMVGDDNKLSISKVMPDVPEEVAKRLPISHIKYDNGVYQWVSPEGETYPTVFPSIFEAVEMLKSALNKPTIQDQISEKTSLNLYSKSDRKKAYAR